MQIKEKEICKESVKEKETDKQGPKEHRRYLKEQNY